MTYGRPRHRRRITDAEWTPYERLREVGRARERGQLAAGLAPWEPAQLDHGSVATMIPVSPTTTHAVEAETISIASIWKTVSDHEHLLDVFADLKATGGAAPGIDGLSYDDYSKSEIAAALRTVRPLIQDGTYRPAPHQVVTRAKRGGGTRELHLRTIVDRVISTAVNRQLTRLLDSLLLPCCLGYRSRRSVWDVLYAIEEAVLRRECFYLKQADMQAAFDMVPLEQTIAVFRQHIQRTPDLTTEHSVDDPRQHMAETRLMRLIEAILRGHDTCRTRGIDQGDALSALALNLLMHHVLDLPLQAAGWEHPLLSRYADNLVVLGRNAPDVREAIHQSGQLLATAGMSLKEEHDDHVCLRRPGAKVTVLGVRISLRGNQLHYEPEESAYTDLRDKLEDAWETPEPDQTAGAILQGWIQAMGMTVGSAGAHSLIDGIRKVALEMDHWEIPTPERMHRWAMEAQERWESFRLRKQAEQHPGG